MALDYLHLPPGTTPPRRGAHPFRAVLIAEEATSQIWRDEVALWLVESECRYFIAWGMACEAWHDTVDWTVLEVFDFGEIPDDKFVMTTWHDKESLSEAFWFAGNAASHPSIELADTLIVHVAQAPHRIAILDIYNRSQADANEP